MERAAYQMRFLSILWNSIEIPKETKAIHGESCCKMSTAAFFFAKVQKALQADKNFRKCQNMNMEVVMTKHETREYAFLLLYEAMVRAEELTTIEDLYASTEEMLELPVPEKVKQYVSGVMSQTEELDNIISEYSKQRSLNRVPVVNRSILRLALYELKNLPQTPVNVVISEAVHLSQAYAYAEDTAFINGVLGAYARSKPAAKEDTADGTNSGD